MFAFDLIFSRKVSNCSGDFQDAVVGAGAEIQFADGHFQDGLGIVLEGAEFGYVLGKHLQKARIDAGLLIKDLAGKIGVTEDTMINWEIRGRMPRPREALRRIFSDKLYLPIA